MGIPFIHLSLLVFIYLFIFFFLLKFGSGIYRRAAKMRGGGCHLLYTCNGTYRRAAKMRGGGVSPPIYM